VSVTYLTMFDSAVDAAFPRGAQAYAAYVDGVVASQPNWSWITAEFPNALHLSITLDPDLDADALDIENGAASPESAAAWAQRQHARGAARPCLYASADTMQALILPALRAAGLERAAVRLWSAHYAGRHICSPSTCGAVSIAVDGTQWTNQAWGRTLDESMLLPDFFGAPAPRPQPSPKPAEDEMPSGTISVPAGMRESHAWAPGSVARIVLFSDWDGAQPDPPVVALRVAHADSAVFDAGPLTLPSLGITYRVDNPGDCDGCSFERIDNGPATVAWRTA